MVLVTTVALFESARSKSENSVKKLTSEVAATIERTNTRAELYSQHMAWIQETRLFGKRAEFIQFAWEMLTRSPELHGISIYYEPDADGQDADFVNAAAAQAISPALTDDGRFKTHLFREQNDHRKLTLKQTDEMDICPSYRVCKTLYLQNNKPMPVMSEPHENDGTMIAEHSYPIIIEGEFKGTNLSRVTRMLSDITNLLHTIKREHDVDLFSHQSRGHFIASTLDQGIEDGNEHSLRTQHLANSTYNELFKELHASRMQQQLVLSKDPNDNEPYYFASAPPHSANG